MRAPIAVLLVLFSSTPSLAQWHVRAGGDSRHSAYVVAAGPTSDNLRWQRLMPAWFGQPIFVESGIVVTTWLTDAPMQDRGVIVAMQIQTGDTLWTRKLPMDFASDWSGYACAMRDGKVYATRAGNSNSSYLYALDALTGQTVWRSQDLTDLYVTEGPVFAENGDLLVGNTNNVTRIRATDGTRVYQVGRGGSISGGREPVVVGNRYYIRAGAVGDRLAAYDLATGQFFYWSNSIGTAQSGLFASNDGTIYVPSSALYAFTDTGSSLTQKWVSSALPNCPFSTFAVGPDGSVYSYKVVSNSVVVVQLHPQTGQEVKVSPPILSGTSIIPGHMAVDRSGILFVTNGAYDLFSFNPDLSLRWSVTHPRSEGGPSLAADGTLLVGANTGVFAFAGDPAGLPGPAVAGAGTFFSRCYPNPFRGETSLRFELPAAGEVSLSVFDPLGREVRRLAGGALEAGPHELRIDGAGLPGGAYFYRLRAGDRVDQGRIQLLR